MKGLKAFLVFTMILSASAFILMGCGDDDGGTSGSTTISGLASKGPISGGLVKVFALNTVNTDGTIGAELGSCLTGPDGSYSIPVGSYRGDVLVEVTDGTYTDEATGDTNISNTLLRAVLPEVTGRVSIAVTPLTEIAFQLANEGGLTRAKIRAANALISNMVGVNIINTLPTDVTSAERCALASVDQITYGLMLAVMSQVVAEGQDPNIPRLMENIRNDLADDQQLNTTGTNLANALSSFLDPNNEQNKTGITDLAQTRLDEAINYIKDNQIDPNQGDVSDLDKAKKMIADLRNTLLTMHNYQGVGMPGIVETPFTNLSQELQYDIAPEVTTTVDTIAWILESTADMLDPTVQRYLVSEEDPNINLEIDILNDGRTANFTLTNLTNSEKIGEGTIGVNDPNQPTHGTFQAELQTTAGETITADLAFSAALSGTSFSSLTLTGLLSAPDYSIDFSQSGRKLQVTLAQTPEPAGEGGLTDDLYPTSVYLAGRITTSTARMDGTLNISSIVWAENGYEDSYGEMPICEGEFRPKKATFQGSFTELKDGASTGVVFTGTITGSWLNASTYNGCLDDGPDNFPQWNATFNGKIEASSRPTITAFIKVTQSEPLKSGVEINFRRINPDKTVIFISGTGTYDETGEYDLISCELTNQDGLTVSFTYGESEVGNEFTGTIQASGGAELAELYVIEDIPMVKYADNYLESVI